MQANRSLPCLLKASFVKPHHFLPILLNRILTAEKDKFQPSFLEKRRVGLAYFLKYASHIILRILFKIRMLIQCSCVLLNPEFSSAPVLKDFIFDWAAAKLDTICMSNWVIRHVRLTRVVLWCLTRTTNGYANPDIMFNPCVVIFQDLRLSHGAMQYSVAKTEVYHRQGKAWQCTYMPQIARHVKRLFVLNIRNITNVKKKDCRLRSDYPCLFSGKKIIPDLIRN